MLKIRTLGAILLVALAGTSVTAKENVGSSGKTSPFLKSQAASCSPASAQIDLEVNNVRTTILNGGDLWWNLNDARYEVPKVDPPGSAPSIHSLFAGAIWLGGIDAGGQLKIAAQTYRQTGNDFWPGPLNSSAGVDDAVCNQYDRFWTVSAREIDTFRIKTFPVPESQVPNNILIWPAKGNPYAEGTNGNITIDQDLAPFYDADGDGFYDPTRGDYPVINTECGTVYGDQMIFWVYNDKGNIHSETGGQAIGVQIGALAFAFSTSDEVNNMTFYRYNITNKANISIGDFYMGQWVDADLGCYQDDYVGCDPSLGLGYVYNGDANDEDCATRGYGTAIPILGVDYFEGPFADAGDAVDNDGDGFTDEGTDGIDNDGDSQIDENDEREKLGMSTFLYYNNDFTVQGNPEAAINFYNYMRGFWKDGEPFTSDVCNGKGGSVPTTYMFPGDPASPLPFPASWSECSCQSSNPPADRRWMQASGPFTLEPGAVNNITVGVVWVRQQSQAGCAANLNLLKAADRKAQALFDNCFKLVDGPDAPSMAIRELDREIILTLFNDQGSNNFQQSYDEADPTIRAIALSDSTVTDFTYTFQGYKVYQLKNQTVSAQELDDPTLARLVAQVDVKDTVDRLINFSFDPTLELDVPALMVDGNNAGITNTFRITNDLFASGTSSLVNHKTYYFAVIAYAHNYFRSQLTGEEQRTPYLQGRRNYKVYTAIPHIPVPSQAGTTLNAAYGDSIDVTRLEGAGNGGFNVDLDSASIEAILASPDHFYGPITYKGLHSPIAVKVTDPYAIKNRKFILTFLPDSLPNNIVFNRDSFPFLNGRLKYRLDIYSGENGDIYEDSIISYQSINNSNEFVVQKGDTSYGVSVTMSQVPNVNEGTVGFDKGFIDGTLTFVDNERPWLTGVQDQQTFSALNWIRSGQFNEVVPPSGSPAADTYLGGFFDDHYVKVDSTDTTGRPLPLQFYDPNEEFERIIGSTWSPYALAANAINGKLDGNGNNSNVLWPTIYSYGPGFTVQYRYSPTNNFEPGTLRDVISGPNYYRPTDNMTRLQGVDLVLTSDKSKWTRCVVVEMGEDSAINENNQVKGYHRLRPSIDQNGNIIAGDTGRSYFPGYAINVETGERLNIMFGEDSWLGTENGRDMIWNPTSNVVNPLNQVLFGGRHCIYIMDSKYDEGNALISIMRDSLAASEYNNGYRRLFGSGINQQRINMIEDDVYQHIMWVTMPIVDSRYPLASLADGLIPDNNTATIRLRVRRPYTQFVVDGSNQGFNKYQFSTYGLEATTNQAQVATDACDLIKAVPNPYYAYSAYETSQLDNKIKITNLPANSTVSIYTIEGTLIRRFSRSVSQVTSEGSSTDVVNLDNTLDWDLKNFKNIPISSGVYLIHIQSDGVCEKVIKWFGVMRPTDLDTF
ncbi:MAG: hypothetical protein SFW35_07570 [Chitinophagales bacterium]|nr:hypothetical protein [Chitinophagales bacterium]